MKRVYQLWGLKALTLADAGPLLTRLDRALKTGAEIVIAGQSSDAALHREVVSRAHQNGVKAYLWAPLFTEYDNFTAFEPLLSAEDKRLPRERGEEFNFRCPASNRNIEAFFAMQDTQMKSAPFDGIFLDRVRYPSFAHGALGALGCFCPRCEALYRENGIDVPKLKNSLTAPRGDNPLTLARFDGSDYAFHDQNIARFFDLRARVITNAVKGVKAHYAKSNQGVALDLFPPSLSYFVGQSLRELLALSDFIKPMLYRFTDAPAGLPFERRAYEKSVGPLFVLDRLLGADSERERILSELSAAEHAKKEAGSDCLIAYGLEVCAVPSIIRAEPERIRETLALFKQAGAQAACASWSLLSAKEENLAAFADST